MVQMHCKRCGANEDRINGFCSVECEEYYRLEEEINALDNVILERGAEIGRLNARIAELEEIDKLRSESVSTLNQANANNEDEIELLGKRIARLEGKIAELIEVGDKIRNVLEQEFDGYIDETIDWRGIVEEAHDVLEEEW